MINYFIEHLWLAWLLVGILCLVLELTNGDFFIMCFAIGAAVASVVSCFSDNLTVQVLAFAIATILSLFFIRPTASKWLHKGREKRNSNVDALIGRVGKVTEMIKENDYGRVQVDGDYWKAKALNNEKIENDTMVKILAIDSTIVTVEKAE